MTYLYVVVVVVVVGGGGEGLYRELKGRNDLM